MLVHLVVFCRFGQRAPIFVIQIFHNGCYLEVVSVLDEKVFVSPPCIRLNVATCLTSLAPSGSVSRKLASWLGGGG